MESTTAWLIGVGALTVLTATVFFFVRYPLLRVLEELCGAGHRADFWLRLYAAFLLLTVLFFALLRTPKPEEDVLAVSMGLFRLGVFGLLASISLLAVFVLVYITGHDRREERLARLDRRGEPDRLA